jgi:hypothetical protein
MIGREGDKEQTPDLFSTGRLDSSPSNNPPEAPPGRPPRRTVLPKDLPRAIRYLEDQELDWLLRTAIHEAKRRGERQCFTVHVVGFGEVRRITV